VNRYEINFINSVDEGRPSWSGLPFPASSSCRTSSHEHRDASIEGNLKTYIRHIAYVHFADSNALAPAGATSTLDPSSAR